MIRVAIPNNLESFADDMQGIAVCAALMVLQNNIEMVVTGEWPISQRISSLQKKTIQYFGGIAHALRHSVTKDPPKGGYSGAFGEGYYFVINQWMESNNIAGTYLNGKSSPPSKYWAGSAWSTKTPQELQRLEALIRRAAKALNLSAKATLYFRTVTQLEGHGIKQDVPWSKVGILTQDESDFLGRKYQAGKQLLDELKNQLKPENVTINVIQTLPNKVREVSLSLKEASLVVDRTTTLRFKALNAGLSKRELQNASKVPIGTRLASMDIITRISYFNPVALTGKIFHVDETRARLIQRGDLQTINEIKDELFAFSKTQSDAAFVPLMDSFLRTF
jgi:hypothetical protein